MNSAAPIAKRRPRGSAKRNIHSRLNRTHAGSSILVVQESLGEGEVIRYRTGLENQAFRAYSASMPFVIPSAPGFSWFCD